jgi:phage major head subunit gpT-like protein
MALTTTNFDEALESEIRAWYGATYKQHPEIYSKYFEVKNTGKKYDYTHSFAAFGLVPEKPEGEATSLVDTKQGYKNTLTQVTYSLGFPVTREMKDFEQYGLIETLTRSLADSVRQTAETIHANTLNFAFNSSYTGADAKELCATDHPTLYSADYQNEPTTASDLSLAALEQAGIDIGNMTTDRGLQINATGVKLIIPPELEWSAKQLLMSDKDPETDLNSMNPAKGLMPYVVNPFLTDPDAWFIQTNVRNGLTSLWSAKPEFTTDNDTASYNMINKTYFRVVSGWGDPRNMYGSPGGA